jgi:hypothetical protein
MAYTHTSNASTLFPIHPQLLANQICDLLPRVKSPRSRNYITNELLNFPELGVFVAVQDVLNEFPAERSRWFFEQCRIEDVMHDQGEMYNVCP